MRLLWIFFLVVILCLPILASDRLENHVAKMTQAVSLSPDQAEKITAILRAAHAQMKRDKINKEVVHDWKAIRQKANSDIMELLTDEQKEKFKVFREEQRKLRKEHLQKMMREHADQ